MNIITPINDEIISVKEIEFLFEFNSSKEKKIEIFLEILKTIENKISLYYTVNSKNTIIKKEDIPDELTNSLHELIPFLNKTADILLKYNINTTELLSKKELLNRLNNLFNSSSFNKETFHYYDSYFRSVEGLTAFARFPNSELLPEYIDCQLEGVKYFDSYFKNQLFPKVDFIDLIKNHHKILASGINNNKSYKLRNSINKESAEFAGKMHEKGLVIGYPITDKNILNLIYTIFKRFNFKVQDEWKIPIKTLEPKALPVGKKFTNGLHIIYAPSDYLISNLRRLEIILSEIKELYLNNKKDSNIRTTFLNLLANYYQLGIVLHIFPRINQSMLMAQINYLLIMFNYKPIFHGNLDYMAFFSPTEWFQILFKEYVEKHQEVNTINYFSI